MSGSQPVVLGVTEKVICNEHKNAPVLAGAFLSMDYFLSGFFLGICFARSSKRTFPLGAIS